VKESIRVVAFAGRASVRNGRQRPRELVALAVGKNGTRELCEYYRGIRAEYRPSEHFADLERLRLREPRYLRNGPGKQELLGRWLAVAARDGSWVAVMVAEPQLR
jgi:hypothetical protein